jgi:uncharacterized protein
MPSERKIWIDLDNVPHVPLFAPIIEELKRKGYSLLLTSRNTPQIGEMLEFHHIISKRVGRGFRKNKLSKIAGTSIRALQLMSLIVREKPVLAVSHGSRAQLLACSLVGLPCVAMTDYEFADSSMLRIGSPCVLVPEVIPEEAFLTRGRQVEKYPGIKEDIYVPRFRPDPAIKAELGVDDEQLLVTVRPPASDAHYHTVESDHLFCATMDFLCSRQDVTTVVLPRNPKQEQLVRESWAESVASSHIIIPSRVVDGLNLIWHSDVVISGGGTMNREAASLGVPVYSIFRGKIGAVDQYLAREGRLVLLATKEDVRTKIQLTRRQHPVSPESVVTPALAAIVRKIEDQIPQL